MTFLQRLLHPIRCRKVWTDEGLLVFSGRWIGDIWTFPGRWECFLSPSGEYHLLRKHGRYYANHVTYPNRQAFVESLSPRERWELGIDTKREIR